MMFIGMLLARVSQRALSASGCLKRSVAQTKNNDGADTPSSIECRLELLVFSFTGRQTLCICMLSRYLITA